MNRVTPLRRAPMKRRRRATGPDLATRLTVLTRDEYRCVICGSGRDLQLHHRRPRSSGGSRDPRVNSPSNLIVACFPCHSWLESRRAEALDHGWLVSQADTPAEVPVAMHDRGAVYLTPDGDTIPVPETEVTLATSRTGLAALVLKWCPQQPCGRFRVAHALPHGWSCAGCGHTYLTELKGP